MNRRDGLDAYTIEGSVDSNVVIAIMDEFSKHLTKKTVVVIDNAPMHTSEAFNLNSVNGQKKDWNSLPFLLTHPNSILLKYYGDL